MNLRLLALPPQLPAKVPEGAQGCVEPNLPGLPRPADVVKRLGNTPFTAECLRIANEILSHRFPILGVALDIKSGSKSGEIRWRRDYISGKETEARYFRSIPYLDINVAGDHKLIWELNRHQHLVLLAQAWLFSGRQELLDEIIREVESWLAQNPFQRGINWASALEVGFRALSWIWIYHLVGDKFESAFRNRFLQTLYRHGLHLEVNLSFYFSPNTHLLGEAVALHALGMLFRGCPRAKQWQETGARVVRHELDRQVLDDGCHFERSTYYHVYALDMFLFHAVLRGVDDAYRSRLTRMAEFLDVVMGESGCLPFFGDDDGGRFFHSYGPRNRFGLATLATCGRLLGHPRWIRNPHDLEEQAVWWLKPNDRDSEAPPGRKARTSVAPRKGSGLVVMAAEDIQLITDTGGFGPGNAGHSHADTLSLVLRRRGEEILIDPGTYTYVADPLWRERFRGTAAHNTVRIDGLDQAVPRGPFAWQSVPHVEPAGWQSSSDWEILTAACRYSGFRHRRKVVFNRAGLLIMVIDRIEGPAGEHRIEQYWHCGEKVRQAAPLCFQIGEKTLLALTEGSQPRMFEGEEFGWRSLAPGSKEPAPVLCSERRVTLPASFATMIDLSGNGSVLRFRVHADDGGMDWAYDDGVEKSARWMAEN